MNEKTQLEILELVKSLGGKTEHLWESLITQVYIANSINIAVYLLFALLTFLGYKKYLDNKTIDIDDLDFYTFSILVIIYTSALTVFLIFFLEISNVITKFTNPDFWVLKSILGN